MKLLVIGDDRKSRRMVLAGFTSDEYHVRVASTPAAVEKLLEGEAFHVACLDRTIKEGDAAAILETVQRRWPRLPVVAIVAPDGDNSGAASAMRGVCATVKIPFAIDGLQSALTVHAAREPVGGRPVDRPAPAPRLIASDEASRRVHETAQRAAGSNVTILILGETGTGKSQLAHTIHQQSPLRNGPFVTVSCPCLNRELLESELFGHVRGAFTGAVQDTWGKVAAAAGGTLFLDEIGDLPPALQPKLLRLLQERHYDRVGETTSRLANVRVIAATNRNLRDEVAAGRFREDLYYRLNVITLEIPPLRQRPADIIAAAESFLAEIDQPLGRRRLGFSAAARRLLETHSWPGNLRELRNVIERAAILSEMDELGPRDFPSIVAPATAPCQVGARVSLASIESAHIQMVVANAGSLEEAARILQIDKSTLYRKRKLFEGRVTDFPPALDAAAAMAT